MKQEYSRYALTGASGGIGIALALHYAAPGVALELAGRDEQVLSDLAQRCREKGAEVTVSTFDVRDERAFGDWIDGVTAKEDLHALILAAGVSASVRSEASQVVPETQWDLARQLDVNATSTILAANRAIGNLLRTRPERQCRIALIASVAALTGLPSSPGYSASKAALVTYGQAMRRVCRGSGISVSVVLPGYVTSPMSRRFVGRKPFEMSAEKAAQIIAVRLEKNRFRIVFPRIVAIGIFLLECLPESLQAFFLKKFEFSVVPDREAQARHRNDP
jgi:short-subunit dehydrogenase